MKLRTASVRIAERISRDWPPPDSGPRPPPRPGAPLRSTSPRLPLRILGKYRPRVRTGAWRRCQPRRLLRRRAAESGCGFWGSFSWVVYCSAPEVVSGSATRTAARIFRLKSQSGPQKSPGRTCPQCQRAGNLPARCAFVIERACAIRTSRALRAAVPGCRHFDNHHRDFITNLE